MKLVDAIVDALAQFPDQEFCARDVVRRFTPTHRGSSIRAALMRLWVLEKIDRRMRYGIYYYRSKQ